MSPDQNSDDSEAAARETVEGVNALATEVFSIGVAAEAASSDPLATLRGRRPLERESVGVPLLKLSCGGRVPPLAMPTPVHDKYVGPIGMPATRPRIARKSLAQAQD
eukprot:6202562-Pleurochrysis_carterae.AAC.2